MLAILVATIMAPIVLPQLTSPVPPPAGLPPQVLQNGAQVDELLRLTISPEGTVEGCKPVGVSGYRALDSHICSLISQIKFAPGKDADGRPIYSVVTAQFRWTEGEAQDVDPGADIDLTLAKLPAGAPFLPITRLAVMVDQKGRVETCNVVRSSGFASLDEVACKAGVDAFKLKAAQDGTGTLQRSIQSVNVGFEAAGANWLRRPTGEQVAEVYPRAAENTKTSGLAVMGCSVTASGAMNDCAIVREVPIGQGFGQAALKLSKYFLMAPTTPDGRSVAGSHVDIPIRFVIH